MSSKIDNSDFAALNKAWALGVSALGLFAFFPRGLYFLEIERRISNIVKYLKANVNVS